MSVQTVFGIQDLANHVLTFLDVEEIVNCSKTNKQLYQCAQMAICNIGIPGIRESANSSPLQQLRAIMTCEATRLFSMNTNGQLCEEEINNADLYSKAKKTQREFAIFVGTHLLHIRFTNTDFGPYNPTTMLMNLG